MATDDRTDRFQPVFEPEEILDRFVKNANAEARAPRDDEPTGVVDNEARRGGPPSWDHEVTVRSGAPWDDDPPPDYEGTRPDAPMVLAMGRAFDPDDDEEEDATAVRKGSALANDPLTDSGQRIVLLTKKKPPSHPPPEPLSWESVVSPRGVHTQRIEAKRVVPDVGAVERRDEPHAGEGVEDGQVPTRQLDQILGDMAVLHRYGHAGQVRGRLEQLRRAYPEDLLLLRRIAEFHVEHDDVEAALETLFALAGGLFERRNVEGMRQALQQVLVLDPENPRAFRLLGLLDQRPSRARD